MLTWCGWFFTHLRLRTQSKLHCVISVTGRDQDADLSSWWRLIDEGGLLSGHGGFLAGVRQTDAYSHTVQG